MFFFLQGISLTAGLIISIGPQNIELLRLGFLKQHVFMMATIFVLCDIFLVGVGAVGVGNIISTHKNLILSAKYLAVILLYYLAYQAFKRMRNPPGLVFNKTSTLVKNKDIFRRGLGLSLLNPLAVLETVILVGSMSASYSWNKRLCFISGSLFVSIIWFYSIAYGAYKLANLFKQSSTQRILEGSIGILLSIIASIFLLSTVK